MEHLYNIGLLGVFIAGVYFFSFQLQKLFTRISSKFMKKLGIFSSEKESSIQRYVFVHRGSFIAKVYNWVNNQLTAIGLKRIGVTPVGYLIFWAVISVIATFLLEIFLSVSFSSTIPTFIILYFVFLVLTRVFVSTQMEKREAQIMDALDLIIPEINSGVQNAITQYVDNFSEDLQPDFRKFISNIKSRGMSFNNAMLLLADNLGGVFNDFAQKAIFAEAQGDKNMNELFIDIIETNRLRRELRHLNGEVFRNLRFQFVVSVLLVAGYFLYIITTDAFSRYFFLTTKTGGILLLICGLIIYGVLAYIATIKSQDL